MKNVSLSDKFSAQSGEIFISGTQAIARLLLSQKYNDEHHGLNTAGFISGYRGSPLGGVDTALWRAGRELESASVVFQPGVNEELAATAVYGTQQLGFFPGAKYDGVFAAWYGKGPGVDRAGDALKHGNLAGTAKNGGVLVFAGDDHPGKSSTTAHQSEQALAASMIPVLYPATVSEIIDFGLFGIALSRFSGLWVGVKCINDTADATATVTLPPSERSWHIPDDVPLPPEGLNIVEGELQLGQERRTVDFRLPAAQAFVRANGMDKVLRSSDKRTLGIISAGKAALDVIEALEELGLTEERCAKLGIRVLKLALTWPVVTETVREFSEGHDQILVVEEKRAFVEPQIAAALFDLPEAKRPLLTGKKGREGETLIPSTYELNPSLVRTAILSELTKAGVADKDLATRSQVIDQRMRAAGSAVTEFNRMPFYCSGCPHNRSTTVPEGTIGLAGIGCHVMAALMPHRKHSWPVQMGGEGANWIGVSPFTETRHVFQNLGDGTYYHSGSLAVRAAVAANANITFKLLFNDAIAMTGGQPIEGQLTVAQVASQMLEEGVKRVVVVADDPDKYPPSMKMPSGVEVLPREELASVQLELAAVEGTTLLIYDQVCAAEKRRRRKRGQFPDPPKRAFINDLVCEGCGDCSAKSNCVSIQPLETEFGRKRKIDQSSCNKDYSCVEGFCPSFVTVHGGSVFRADSSGSVDFDSLPVIPSPSLRPLERTWSLLVAGIGGTGVVTIGAVLGMAAHLEERSSSIIDMTGLSQKNGAVFSHLKIGASVDQAFAARIGPAAANMVLGCDMLTSAGQEAMSMIQTGATVGVINDDVTPTAAFTMNRDVDFKIPATRTRLTAALHADKSRFINASHLATLLLGDSIASNMLLLGAAAQLGELPVSVASIEAAITLNAVSIEMNLRAFQLGRLAVANPTALEDIVKRVEAKLDNKLTSGSTDLSLTRPEKIARRASFLRDYQNDAYATRYQGWVEKIEKLAAAYGDKGAILTDAVISNLFKLMAYKDEYEVARLYASDEFTQKIRRQFSGDFKLKFHLAPPLFARKDKATGLPRKIQFGSWMLSVFKMMAPFKFLRGTAFDPFGYTGERRMERRLIAEYEELLEKLVTDLAPDNIDTAIALAQLPQDVRGFGHVKDKSVREMSEKRVHLLNEFKGPKELEGGGNGHPAQPVYA